MGRTCINCGKPIAKKTQSVRFDKPRPYRAETYRVLGGRKYTDLPEQKEIVEGHREVSHSITVIYTNNPPRTKAECQRFVNGEIVSVRRHFADRDIIHEFGYWDGVSYVDKFFHNGACAQEFAYKAAKAGVRF
jgi:hypothetical protein